jgi:hypothetical protein
MNSAPQTITATYIDAHYHDMGPGIVGDGLKATEHGGDYRTGPGTLTKARLSGERDVYFQVERWIARLEGSRRQRPAPVSRWMNASGTMDFALEARGRASRRGQPVGAWPPGLAHRMSGHA